MVIDGPITMTFFVPPLTGTRFTKGDPARSPHIGRDHKGLATLRMLHS